MATDPPHLPPDPSATAAAPSVPPGPAPGAKGGALATLGSWLASIATRTCQVATALAVAAGITGAVALVLGVLAWRDSAAAVLIVVLVGGSAMAAPWYVTRRIRPMAQAVTDPERAGAEAKAYLSGLQSSPELDQLLTKAGASRGGRARGLYRTSRLVGSVVARVSPDPHDQPLLAAFHPVRLRALWLAVILTWWLWFVSVLLATVAAFQLAIDAVA